MQRLIAQEVDEYDKFELQYYDVKKGDVLKQLVSIGGECYVQAEVQADQVRMPFLHIGQGIHIQFDRESDMLEFIEKRKSFLLAKADYFSSKIDMMRQDVEQVLKHSSFSAKFAKYHVCFFLRRLSKCFNS